MSTLTAAPKRPEFEATFRAPPPGFTDEQWRTFRKDGIVCIPDAIEPDQVAQYLAAIQESAGRHDNYDPAHTWKIRNAVTEHAMLRELIDHDRHVGYAYDLYGEQTRLLQADVFMRPTGSVINHWHVDGPRSLPYRAFSPVLPLKLRIGYWLTDVEEPDMGNLVYLPGSHDAREQREFTGIGDVEGQKVVCCRAGTMTIAHASLWHRVMRNANPRTRVNLFLSYAPSWITGYYHYNLDWVAELGREQRIILRAYSDPEDLTRPPASDLPLFATKTSPQAGLEEPHKIRCRTRYETHLGGL